jgi:hypothetical protein
MLPAIVTGLREDAWTDETGGDEADARAAYSERARRALGRLVDLAFSRKGYYDLEASLAQGFKGDAMRHADDVNGSVSGPGWVAGNRELAAEICLPNANFWYAKMLLHQALGLYAIVGSDAPETLDTYSQVMPTSP